MYEKQFTIQNPKQFKESLVLVFDPVEIYIIYYNIVSSLFLFLFKHITFFHFQLNNIDYSMHVLHMQPNIDSSLNIIINN